VLEAGMPAPVQWWRAFHSAKLDALVAQALARNSDLAAAEATLRQARELARAAGAQGPQLDASYQAQRARVSQVLATPLADANATLYTLHTAQLSVSYPLDLFGAGRSRSRSARAAADVAQAKAAAARGTLVANLTLAVIQHAALAAQADATRQSIAADAELLNLARTRRRLGDAGDADVAAAETALAGSQQQLPMLERQSRHQQSLIGTLIGIPAGASVPDLPALAELALPDRLPASLPAQVVARRPDVRSAEAQVRGAAADLGTAIAARLPSFTLTGNAGGAAGRFADLLAGPNLFYTFAAGATQPLFHSGQLLHQQRAASAALDAARAQYRSAALQAFLDVDDALAGLAADATALDAATVADAAAGRTLKLARRQLGLGAIGHFALLGVEAGAASAASQRIQAQAARLSDSVALFLACGTWDGKDMP
jgi:NodT family efflux transporter outer membrane factor (OMF) lipoprotein